MKILSLFSQDLRLDLQRDAEGRDDIVDAKRHARAGPEQHHARLQTRRVVLSVVYEDLWQQLRAPADGAEGAEAVGCDGVVHAWLERARCWVGRWRNVFAVW